VLYFNTVRIEVASQVVKSAETFWALSVILFLHKIYFETRLCFHQVGEWTVAKIQNTYQFNNVPSSQTFRPTLQSEHRYCNVWRFWLHSSILFCLQEIN
jgi:hypothetical protein